MNQPDQWRFQWPDGTWIRWNPQTQSWEKEAPGEEGVVDVLEPAPEVAPPPVEIVKSRRDRRSTSEPKAEPELAVEPETELVPAPEPDFVAEPDPVAAEPIAAVQEVPLDAESDEPVLDEPVVAASTRSRRRRPTTGDVLPPSAEPDKPAGSLWPTIITGMVVGVGVGLLLWNLIR